MAKMNSYTLSRKWFDWCFENPDHITPNHTALYFFCIEHCNRLGWKEKFGLPTTMAKEAIGIRSYNTYINTLNDLVLFGFIKLIEKSKNQYSSNIIALSNFDKAQNKALDKALIKHGTKRVKSTHQSIDSIDKQDNKEQETTNNTWRENFDLYKSEMLKAQSELIGDQAWLAKQETYYPNIDIKLSLQKAVEQFWGTEAGWKHKKKSRSKEIDYKATLTNALSQSGNKVYKQRENTLFTNTSNPQTSTGLGKSKELS